MALSSIPAGYRMAWPVSSIGKCQARSDRLCPLLLFLFDLLDAVLLRVVLFHETDGPVPCVDLSSLSAVLECACLTGHLVNKGPFF